MSEVVVEPPWRRDEDRDTFPESRLLRLPLLPSADHARHHPRCALQGELLDGVVDLQAELTSGADDEGDDPVRATNAPRRRGGPRGEVPLRSAHYVLDDRNEKCEGLP